MNAENSKISMYFVEIKQEQNSRPSEESGNGSKKYTEVSGEKFPYHYWTFPSWRKRLVYPGIWKLLSNPWYIVAPVISEPFVINLFITLNRLSI